MSYDLSKNITNVKNSTSIHPVEFYDIFLGSSQTSPDSETLHFVNYIEDINFFDTDSDAQSYWALAIVRNAVKRITSTEINRVSVEVDNVNQGMSAYAAKYDFRNKRIVIRWADRRYLTSANDAKIVFDGRIEYILFPPQKAQISCVSSLGSLNIECGWMYQINCNTKFGSTRCGVDKDSAANKYSGRCDSATTTTITDTNLSQANDYWNYGEIEITSGDGISQKRKVLDFAAGVVTLDYAFTTTPSANDRYTIYRGCDKALDTCDDTYSNTANYRGFHTIPLKKDALA